MKEFCPTSCGLIDDDSPVCEGKAGRDSCWHSNDEIYSNPIPIEMIWYSNVWIDALILGENGDDYIIDSPKSEGVTYIKKSSPLLK